MAELAVDLLDLVFLLGDLGPQVLAHLVVAFGGEQLPGVGQLGVGPPVLPVQVDDRAQLLMAPAGVSGRALVTRGVDLGQLRLELLKLGLEVRQLLEHRARVPTRLRAQLTTGTGSKWPPSTGWVSWTPSHDSPVAYKVRKSTVGTTLPVSSSLVSDGGSP